MNRREIIITIFILIGFGAMAWANGIFYNLTQSYQGEEFFDWFGHSVSSAGDFNGDGFYDFVVGAPNFTSETNGTIPGYAVVFSGRNGQELLRLDGPSSLNKFGWSVSGNGNVDQDEFDDLVIGAPSFDYNNLNNNIPGSAFVVTANETFHLVGYNPDDQFGFSVALAGDVNGDGGDDILVGIPKDGDQAGFALFSGDLLNQGQEEATLAHIQFGNSVALGMVVTGVGDLNEDGYSDIAVTEQYPHKVRIYYGSLSGLNSTPLELVQPGNITSIASAGDVNGDGHLDFIVGIGEFWPEGGHARVYFGVGDGTFSSIIEIPNPILQGNNAWFGYSVTAGGDVNCNGRREILISAPYNYYYGTSGKVFVFELNRNQNKFKIVEEISTSILEGGFGYSLANSPLKKSTKKNTGLFPAWQLMVGNPLNNEVAPWAGSAHRYLSQCILRKQSFKFR